MEKNVPKIVGSDEEADTAWDQSMHNVQECTSNDGVADQAQRRLNHCLKTAEL